MKFKHYKGGIYTYLYDAVFTDGAELLRVVVYEDGTGRKWVRSTEEFYGTIELYGEDIFRFEKIEE